MQRLEQIAEDYMHLVFVHLGNAEAPHLWKNIARAKKIFPSIPITLIYSDSSFIKNRDNIKISLFQYSVESLQTSPINNLAHDITFRKGFWRFSLERIFALAKWHEANPGVKLLHFESDILPMPNFPFEEFEGINKLAWCGFNESHDVASIVYSPESNQTMWLAQRINQLLTDDKSLTDMTCLRLISKNDSEKMIYLNKYKENNLFDGVFDAAPFGMWLTGRDPRNHHGFVKRFQKLPESDIDVDDYEFYFGQKGNLTIRDKSGKVQSLYNLHVHSKIQNLFGPMWRPTLAILVFSSKFRFPSIWFSPRSFIIEVKDFRLRHANLNLMQKLIRICITNKREN